MEAGNPTADAAREPARRGVPAWVLGLVPLLLIIAAVGAFSALGGPGLGERTGPPAEELAIERTKLVPGAIELTVRNDGPGPGLGRPGRRQRRVRGLPRRRAADRPPGLGEARHRAALERGRGLHGRAADLQRRDDRARDPGRRAHARRRHRLLRPHGAARDLRRRHPDRARDALAAVDPAHPAELAARRHGADGRAAGVPGDRRDARGRRARGGGIAGVRRRRARLPRRGVRLPRADRRRLVAGPAPPRPRRGRRRAARRSRCSSPSGSGCTTSARGWRSAPPTRPVRSRSARFSSSASRCTTRPRGWRSSRRSPTRSRR